MAKACRAFRREATQRWGSDLRGWVGHRADGRSRPGESVQRTSGGNRNGAVALRVGAVGGRKENRGAQRWEERTLRGPRSGRKQEAAPLRLLIHGLNSGYASCLSYPERQQWCLSAWPQRPRLWRHALSHAACKMTHRAYYKRRSEADPILLINHHHEQHQSIDDWRFKEHWLLFLDKAAWYDVRVFAVH